MVIKMWQIYNYNIKLKTKKKLFQDEKINSIKNGDSE